jgi:transcriptional regulator with XRE-family HTH domain
MNERERAALEAAGFRIGDAEDFLELTDEERGLVELRVAVSRAVRARREALGLTQEQVAKKLKTSQPRVALIEAGARAASLDAMFRGLFILGGTIRDLQPGPSVVPGEETARTAPSVGVRPGEPVRIGPRAAFTGKQQASKQVPARSNSRRKSGSK